MDFGTIGTVLFSGKHLVVPDYQRDYAWGKSDVPNLWNDIVELVDENKKDHFLGAIVTSSYDARDSFLSVLKPSAYHLGSKEVARLLDGQQRLTSLSMLLASSRDVVAEDRVLSDGRKESLDEDLHELLFDNERP